MAKLNVEQNEKIKRLLLDGVGPSEIARTLGCSRASVYNVKMGLLGSHVGTSRELDIAGGSSIEFLRAARDNAKVPMNNRIQAAIAVAKIETGVDDRTWKPPEDPKMWGEALRDAIEAQSPEVRKIVRSPEMSS